MDRDYVLAPVRAGLAALDDDADLLKKGVSERAVTAKFGSHLRRLLPPVLKNPDYFRTVPTAERLHVDCEFNKHGDDTKRIVWEYEIVHPGREDPYYAPVPDIVLHRRGPQGPHVLSLEVKKDVEPDGPDLLLDEMKLVGDLGPNPRYAFGLFLRPGVDGDAVRAREALLTTREAVTSAGAREAGELQRAGVELAGKTVSAVGWVYVRRALTPAEDAEARGYYAEVGRLYAFSDVRSESA